ncbi:MAG TPA: OmpA family protein [Cytophagales bacterium]|nr:OmpA family protein [Cytophagales bacterium]
MSGVQSFSKVILLPFILAWSTILAQYNFSSSSTEESTTLKVTGKGSYRKAKKLLFEENYIVALPYLEQTISQWKSQGKNTDKLMYQLAICYVVSKSPSKGLALLDSLERSNPKVHPDLIYWKAVALHYDLQFDKAIEYYNKALRLFSVTGTEKNEIKKKIKECENGKLLMQGSGNFEIVNAGNAVNTVFSEHSPTMESDARTLYFTSRKNIDGEKATFTGEYFEDIYITKLDSNSWEKPTSHKDFNTREHDACSQITNQDQTMVMYRSTRNGDIYISRKENNKWSKPEVVKGLNSMSDESSAFLIPDGSRIYFSSNKFSDNGDLDIYFMDKTGDDKWGRPQNIGNHINTPYNEDGIFITTDGQTLYFSSQGHNSMGGFDIFKCKLEGNKWSKPENLGHPVNSPSDDIYYMESPNRKFSLFSSYREGGYGMRDLYLSVPTNKVIAKIQIIDSMTQRQVDSSVTLVLKGSTTGEISENLPVGSFEKEINNRESYGITILKGNRVLHEDTMNVYRNVRTGLTLDKIIVVPYHTLKPKRQVKDTTEVRDTMIINKEHIYGNIYFVPNHSKITKHYFSVLYELIKVMKENPDINIEVQGYADDSDDIEYNKQLSDLRAHNVYDFLTSRGISRKRITYKGYGHKKPTNDTGDSKENRRARFVKKIK